jgi:DNA-binding transcriptional regulator YdaS (Cro superfamily)
MRMSEETFETVLGSTTQLARALGLPVGTVACWKHRGQIPIERAIQIEEILGIPREVLRPDIFRRAKGKVRK